jgi:hypothetical protein
MHDGRCNVLQKYLTYIKHNDSKNDDESLVSATRFASEQQGTPSFAIAKISCFRRILI